MSQPDNIPPTDCYMGLKKSAAYSDIGLGTLRDRIRAGELPAYKVKGRILIKKSEFDAWIESHKIDTKQKLNEIIDSALAAIKSQ